MALFIIKTGFNFPPLCSWGSCTLRTFPSNEALFWKNRFNPINPLFTWFLCFRSLKYHLENSSQGSDLCFVYFDFVMKSQFSQFSDRFQDKSHSSATIHRCSRLTQGNFFTLWIMPRLPLNKILRELPLRVAIGNFVTIFLPKN